MVSLYHQCELQLLSWQKQTNKQTKSPKNQTPQKPQSTNQPKKQTKNPLVFFGSVRSAADLFVEAGEQEGGSTLDWRSGQYFYDRIHIRGDYLEPAVLSRLVELVVCVALQSVLEVSVLCLSLFCTFCLSFDCIYNWPVLIFSWDNIHYGSNSYFSKVIFTNQIIFL